MLTYAKRVIEECYSNTDIDSKYGPVFTNAEYIYGDSVANYTPIYIKVNDEVCILTIEELAEKYGDNNWVNCTEPGKQEKEFCELKNVETWTDKGWTKLFRVIRHILASHKKMIRILTHTGFVDVTDDHSLVNIDGAEITPNDVQIGTELLHKDLPLFDNKNIFITEQEAQISKEIFVCLFFLLLDLHLLLVLLLLSATLAFFHFLFSLFSFLFSRFPLLTDGN